MPVVCTEMQEMMPLYNETRRRMCTWHNSANRSRMERQRSTLCAASLYSGEELLEAVGVPGAAVSTCLAAVSLSQHSLHGNHASVYARTSDTCCKYLR